MPRACAHDVVGGAVENALCCEIKREVIELWRSKRVAIDAFFLIAIFIFNRNRAILGVRMHGLLTVLCVQRDVHDNSAATSPLTCSMRETLMRMRSVSKLAFLSVMDIHTYIPTQNEMRSRISCLALRRSAIIIVYIRGESE